MRVVLAGNDDHQVVEHSASSLEATGLGAKPLGKPTFGNPCWARAAYIRAIPRTIAKHLIHAIAQRLFFSPSTAHICHPEGRRAFIGIPNHPPPATHPNHRNTRMKKDHEKTWERCLDVIRDNVSQQS
ncbi:MAG: hypothetical protein WBO28_08100, partial [Flavobacteriales bacterium]